MADAVRARRQAVDEGAARAALQLRLRARGVNELDVLRALDVINRAHFAAPGQAHLASRDLTLPATHGGSVPEPWLLGRMACALTISRGDRLLEIGTGTGYGTAVLAQLAAHVVSIERFAAGAAAAKTRLDELGLENVTLHVADLMNLPPDLGRFSRILVHGCLAGYPNALLRCLAPGGALVLGRANAERPTRRHLVRAAAGADGRWAEDIICDCRLPLMLAG